MNEKLVGFTFDDGPNTNITTEVLDLLEQHQIKASFFLIGDRINEETAKVVKRAFDMGCEIQNHSRRHLDMTNLTKEQIEEEIRYTDEKIFEITGVHTSFFRPPFILTNELMYQTIQMPFICGVGCNDWVPDYPTEERIKSMKESITDGTLVLLHDMTGNKNTVEAIKVMIPWLKENGYRFVTVSEMFREKNVTPLTTVMYSVVPPEEK